MALDALLPDHDDLKEARYQLLSSFFPYLETELNHTGVTGWVPWGEYRQQHLGRYSYSQCCEDYRHWKASRSGTLHLAQEPPISSYVKILQYASTCAALPGKQTLLQKKNIENHCFAKRYIAYVTPS